MQKQNRRRFIKSTLLGGVGAMALPNPLPSHIWAAETKPNSRLTMGFVGMGRMAQGLLGSFLGQNTQVIAVCDVDPTRHEAAKRRVDEYYAQRAGAGVKPAGCAAYNDCRELIARKDIDAVCIATPDHWRLA